jgi:hypothetical protein
VRELIRRVASDCTIEVDSNLYSVPWRLIGESVLVTVTNIGLLASLANLPRSRHT